MTITCMKKTLSVLNSLVQQNVIKDYAIGGAMGAMWYMEAVATMDLDVFVIFIDDQSLVPLKPIYDKLKELGYTEDEQQKECINIEGVPVQFLPVYDSLLDAAMKKAKGFDYEGVATKVLTAEYLAAICVKTGRIKDKLRVAMFLQSAKFDKREFFSILSKFALMERFSQWKIM